MTKTSWRRTGRSVAIDTRGINAGTAEGRKALKAAQEIIRRSDSLGPSASPRPAQAFNRDAQRTAEYVRSVGSQHRETATRKAADHNYVMSLVKARAGRR